MNRKDRNTVPPVTNGAPTELHDAIDRVFVRAAEQQRSLGVKVARIVALGLVLVLIVVAAGVALGVAVVAS